MISYATVLLARNGARDQPENEILWQEYLQQISIPTYSVTRSHYYYQSFRVSMLIYPLRYVNAIWTVYSECHGSYLCIVFVGKTFILVISESFNVDDFKFVLPLFFLTLRVFYLHFFYYDSYILLNVLCGLLWNCM